MFSTRSSTAQTGASVASPSGIRRNEPAPRSATPRPALPAGAAAASGTAAGRFPVIETPRLVLREIVPGDAADLLAVHGDAQAMRWFGHEPIGSLAEAAGLVRQFAAWRRSGTGTRWGIESREDGRLVGSCGLFGWDRDAHKCAVGYELGSAAQGRGYMREALAAVLPWGFERMRLHRIEAHIHPCNEASLKLALKVGFTVEGRLRESACWGGRHHDMLMLSLLRSEYRGVPAARPQPQATADPGTWQPLVQWMRRLAGQC